MRFPGGGHVCSYFYQAFLDLWNGGIRDDFLSAKNANPEYELWARKFKKLKKFFRSLGTLSAHRWPV